MELYARAAKGADLSHEPHAFVTSNSEDFSLTNGDTRNPHPDIEAAFTETGSTYALGVEGLNSVLLEHFGDELQELFAETDFAEEPRRLDEIQGAEQRLFDRLWYHRSLQHEYRFEDAGDRKAIENLRAIAGPARTRVEQTYTEAGELGPYSDFELGMLSGKLSALRWVLGSEWTSSTLRSGQYRLANETRRSRSPHPLPASGLRRQIDLRISDSSPCRGVLRPTPMTPDSHVDTSPLLVPEFSTVQDRSFSVGL